MEPGPGVTVSCTGRKGNAWAEGLAGLAKSCFWDAENWKGGWGEAKGESKQGVCFPVEYASEPFRRFDLMGPGCCREHDTKGGWNKPIMWMEAAVVCLGPEVPLSLSC